MRNTIQNFACNSWSKRLGLYVCFLLLMVGTIWAQNQTIKGTVLDANGESIIGASVLQKGTTNGTITDFEGGFILNNVPSDATIEISFVGYKTQMIPVNGRSTFNIVLKEDNEILDEVVVIGYGVQKKADLTGSVGTNLTHRVMPISVKRCKERLPVWISFHKVVCLDKVHESWFVVSER